VLTGVGRLAERILPQGLELKREPCSGMDLDYPEAVEQQQTLHDYRAETAPQGWVAWEAKGQHHRSDYE
jgi:hypothetical protein